MAVGALGAGAAGVLASQAGDDSSPPRVQASVAEWRWAPRNELPSTEQAEPVPEERTAAAAGDAEPEFDVRDDPPPQAPPVPKDLDSDDELARAEVLSNGVALPPLQAPAAVRAIFEAGNTIARSPYKWGGGHGRWQDDGYDCSGSVSFALAAAGLLDAPLNSGGLMRWGAPGKGKWVTIYTNPGHVFMVVAGVRFDTTARKLTGSRWMEEMRSTSGYVVRHPPGL
jgi:cell wall-associated NlpC family hydrolase